MYQETDALSKVEITELCRILGERICSLEKKVDELDVIHGYVKRIQDLQTQHTKNTIFQRRHVEQLASKVENYFNAIEPHVVRAVVDNYRKLESRVNWLETNERLKKK